MVSFLVVHFCLSSFIVIAICCLLSLTFCPPVLWFQTESCLLEEWQEMSIKEMQEFDMLLLHLLASRLYI